MSFVRMLGMASFVPEQVNSKSDAAKIPDIDRGRFQSIASNAKAWCPVSKLMNTEIGFEATLDAG